VLKYTLMIAIGLTAAACADPPARPVNSATAVPGDAGAEDDEDELVAEEPTDARDEPPNPSPPPPPDYHARATKNAATVFRNLQPAIRECYAQRLKGAPHAHANITMDVLIGPGGKVRSVDTTGGALLGDRAMGCIVEKVRGATFDPPHGGGTLRINVPFAFRAITKTVGDAGVDAAR
jgi:hypothetical protein